MQQTAARQTFRDAVHFQLDDLNSCQYSIKTIVAESAVKS
jgi:hypothetical protein